MSVNKDANLSKMSNAELKQYNDNFYKGQQKGAFTRAEESKIQTNILREANERFMKENPPTKK